jgi:hypothetical protein
MVSHTDDLELKQQVWEDRAEESEEGDEGEDDGDYEAGDEGEEEVRGSLLHASGCCQPMRLALAGWLLRLRRGGSAATWLLHSCAQYSTSLLGRAPVPLHANHAWSLAAVYDAGGWR